MPIYEIKPVSLPNGEFAAAWFDDDAGFWDDDRLLKPQSVVATWRRPSLILRRPERGATPVLFNPNAYAVSDEVRNKLAGFREIEFLPIEVADDTYFILHMIMSCEAPDGCRLRRAPPPSGNIVELFAFPDNYMSDADFFRLRQPKDSAAGRAGYCTRASYASDIGARAMEAACSSYLNCVRLDAARASPHLH
jgi:hypothetical protein